MIAFHVNVLFTNTGDQNEKHIPVANHQQGEQVLCELLQASQSGQKSCLIRSANGLMLINTDNIAYANIEQN
jgi:hypothetical protein